MVKKSPCSISEHNFQNLIIPFKNFCFLLECTFRPLQVDSLFPISSTSKKHEGGRFIIHYSIQIVGS